MGGLPWSKRGVTLGPPAPIWDPWHPSCRHFPVGAGLRPGSSLHAIGHGGTGAPSRCGFSCPASGMRVPWDGCLASPPCLGGAVQADGGMPCVPPRHPLPDTLPVPAACRFQKHVHTYRILPDEEDFLAVQVGIAPPRHDTDHPPALWEQGHPLMGSSVCGGSPGMGCGRTGCWDPQPAPSSLLGGLLGGLGWCWVGTAPH